MIDDVGDIRGMHARQHLGQISDGATAEKPLNGDQPHVGLRLSTAGVTRRIFPERLPIRKSRRLGRLDGEVVNNLTPQAFVRLPARIRAL